VSSASKLPKFVDKRPSGLQLQNSPLTPKHSVQAVAPTMMSSSSSASSSSLSLSSDAHAVSNMPSVTTSSSAAFKVTAALAASLSLQGPSHAGVCGGNSQLRSESRASSELDIREERGSTMKLHHEQVHEVLRKRQLSNGHVVDPKNQKGSLSNPSGWACQVCSTANATNAERCTSCLLPSQTKALDIMSKGCQVVKYNWNNKTSKRVLLFLSSDFKSICWGKSATDKKASSVALTDFHAVADGPKTLTLQDHAENTPDKCLSLIRYADPSPGSKAGGRAHHDFVFSSSEDCQLWVRMLTQGPWIYPLFVPE